MQIEQKYIELFNTHVDSSKECWIWTAYKLPSGYGQFHIKGKTVLAHRVSYQIHNKLLDPNMLVCHECDNPSCVNPKHLFLGTHKDNVQDMISKGRKVSSKSPKPSLQGEKHHNSKYDEKIIREIKFSKEKMTLLSKKYGLNYSHIRKIKAGTSWGHVN